MKHGKWTYNFQPTFLLPPAMTQSRLHALVESPDIVLEAHLGSGVSRVGTPANALCLQVDQGNTSRQIRHRSRRRQVIDWMKFGNEMKNDGNGKKSKSKMQQRVKVVEMKNEKEEMKQK